MRNLAQLVYKKWSFYSVVVLSSVVLLTYQNCGKVKFTTKKATQLVAQSCGTITMNPANGLAPTTDVTFTVTPAAGVAITDIQWEFTKGQSTTPVYTSSTNPAVHSFDGAKEGVGDYLATATFMKDDGNGCELVKSFQIISGDLCVDPSGISGPSIGFVGEVTSPFSVDIEDCFVGSVEWDMDGDGIPEFTNWDVRSPVTHVYPGPATYTVRARVTNTEDNSQTILTHTILIKYPNCDNGATNPPTCTQCPAGQALVNNQCVPTCANGATNPPACTTCPAGQSMVNGQCTPTCQNGATNPPTCNQCPTGYALQNNICVPVSNCTLDGVIVPHGQSHVFYRVNSLECGQTCSSLSRTCDAGTLLGDPAFNRASCAEASCGYAWSEGAWSVCSATACGTTGTQSRSVICRRTDGATVSDSFCAGTGPKPATSQNCSAAACPPQTHFPSSSCGFGLDSSPGWQTTPGEPHATPTGCEWGGWIYFPSRGHSADATFWIADYFDNSGPYGIYRLNNPNDWTITATGCTLGTLPDPKDYRKKMPNYCKANGGMRYYSGTPLVWNATITAVHKTTGEVRTRALTAVFKPTETGPGGTALSTGTTTPPSTGGGAGTGSGGGGGNRNNNTNTQAL